MRLRECVHGNGESHPTADIVNTDVDGTEIADMEGPVERYCPLWAAARLVGPYGFVLEKEHFDGRGVRMSL